MFAKKTWCPRRMAVVALVQARGSRGSAAYPGEEAGPCTGRWSPSVSFDDDCAGAPGATFTVAWLHAPWLLLVQMLFVFAIVVCVL